MTGIGHNVVMKKKEAMTVPVAEFKAKLSGYLRQVRAGRSLTIVSHGQPVARVEPAPPVREKLQVIPATRRLEDIKLSPPLKPMVDSVAVLLEDRQKDRW
jgi:prevent-host-death family protein